MKSMNMLSLYLQSGESRHLFSLNFNFKIYPYCLFVFVHQRCPHTLVEICRNMGICDVLRQRPPSKLHLGFMFLKTGVIYFQAPFCSWLQWNLLSWLLLLGLLKQHPIILPGHCNSFGRSGGHFKNAYELLNLRALKISMLYKSYIFSCDQAALWMVQSVCLSVCPSVCHTFLTMFPSSYHHEIFRSYYQWQKWRPCKRSRSEVKGQGHRGHNPTSPFPDCNSSLNSHMMMRWCI